MHIICLNTSVVCIDKFAPDLAKQSLWRNGLAHWTSNSKVVGSSPTRDVLSIFFFLLIIIALFFCNF